MILQQASAERQQRMAFACLRRVMDNCEVQRRNYIERQEGRYGQSADHPHAAAGS